jgi:hypothetical protein
MTGGLLQLVAYGAQDVYLTGNPQITFFKVVYRRHTNFAIEVIEREFIGDPGFDKRLTCIIGRDGDLISKMYLKVTVSSVNTDGNNFAWVRRLGHAIINTVEVELGGTILDRQYGTWLDIWYELARQGDHERGYSYMIGDIPELTRYESNNKSEYTMFIPLQFWFNRHVGLSIPMIALQYHDVRIHVRFSQKNEVIISDCNFDSSQVAINDVKLLVNYVYLDSDERRRFAQVGHEYLIEQIQFNGLERVLDLNSRYTLDYNHPTKEIFWVMKNGIYTTNTEFVYYTHLENWDEIDPDRSDEDVPINLAAKKIITESISIGTDPTDEIGGNWSRINGQSIASVGNINITNNNSNPVYVNPESLKIDGYGITDKINADIQIDTNGNILFNSIDCELTVRDLSFPISEMIDTRYNKCDPKVYQFHNYGILLDGTGNPIKEGLLQLNGHDRFDRREGAYFNWVQPEQHHSNTPADGINVYSFALYPEQHQPSGTANLTRIDSTELILEFCDATICNVPTSILPEFPVINNDNRIYHDNTHIHIYIYTRM